MDNRERRTRHAASEIGSTTEFHPDNALFRNDNRLLAAPKVLCVLSDPVYSIVRRYGWLSAVFCYRTDERI